MEQVGSMPADQIAELEPVLHAYARRAVRSAEAAADLVQETLLAAVANRAPFEGRSKLRTWLIGILTNKIKDYFRKRSREPEVDADPADLLTTSPSAAADRVLARRQALAILDDTLPSLPENERLAVLMIDVEGMERAEVCNILDVKPTHLRVLLHRGRHRLRRALEDAGMSSES